MREFFEDYGETIALTIAFMGICMIFFKVCQQLSGMQFFDTLISLPTSSEGGGK